MVQQACSRQKLIRCGSGFSHLVHIPAMTSRMTFTTPSDGLSSNATPFVIRPSLFATPRPLFGTARVFASRPSLPSPPQILYTVSKSAFSGRNNFTVYSVPTEHSLWTQDVTQLWNPQPLAQVCTCRRLEVTGCCAITKKGTHCSRARTGELFCTQHQSSATTYNEHRWIRCSMHK
jgi:hypothetical protein